MRRGSLAAVGLILVHGLWSCGGGSGSVGSPTSGPGVIVQQGGSNPPPPFLDLVPDAPFNTPYRGVRVIWFDYGTGILEYREEVGANGAGEFAIKTLAILTPMTNEQLFLALQDLRQGFNYRYRDFRIHDIGLFEQNYTVTIVNPTVTVAGIPCVEIRVDRLVSNTGNYYEVCIDPNTGMVLRWMERASNGTLIGSMEFESFAYNADVSDMDLRGALYSTQSLGNDAQAAQGIVGYELFVPTLPPQGYVLEDIERVVDTVSGEWIKIYFTDGLDRAMLMHQERTTSLVQAGRCRWLPFGPWTIAAGDIEGFEYTTAGRVTQDDVFLMLQSAID